MCEQAGKGRLTRLQNTSNTLVLPAAVIVLITALGRTRRSLRWFTVVLALTFCGDVIAQESGMIPWVRHLKGNKGVIIFVHGITGDARSAWTSGKESWPSMLTHDHSFDGQDIYVYQYPSPRFKKSFSIDEIADNMRLVLKTDGVLQHDQLTFVSHSMGGLVTRAFILKYRYVVPKIRLLYFLATPTTGSPNATLASLFSKNPQFGQLVPMESDNYLGTLQSNWLAANLGLKSYCAYELQPLFGMIIVERQSATNLCTQALDPVDANHIDIAKPPDQNSAQYRALKEAFEETATAQPQPPQAKPVPSPMKVKPNGPVQTNTGPCGINNIGGTVSGNTCVVPPPIVEADLELRCELSSLPIHVSPTETAHIWLLNQKVRKDGGFYDVEYQKATGDSWPSKDLFAKDPHNNGTFDNRCVASNEGNAKLFDILLTFDVYYEDKGKPPQGRSYSVVINPLDPGKDFVFYIVNECPVNVAIVGPSQYTARMFGQSSRQSFPILRPHHLPDFVEQTMDFFPSTVAWVEGCN